MQPSERLQLRSAWRTPAAAVSSHRALAVWQRACADFLVMLGMQAAIDGAVKHAECFGFLSECIVGLAYIYFDGGLTKCRIDRISPFAKDLTADQFSAVDSQRIACVLPRQVATCPAPAPAIPCAEFSDFAAASQTVTPPRPHSTTDKAPVQKLLRWSLPGFLPAKPIPSHPHELTSPVFVSRPGYCGVL